MPRKPILLCIIAITIGTKAYAQWPDRATVDPLFATWCDTTVGRYPRTISLAQVFSSDSTLSVEQASRLARIGTMPGLGERQRKFQLAYAWHARGTMHGFNARTDSALACFAEATKVFEGLNDHAGIVGTQCYIADLYLARGRLTEAVCTMQPAAQEYLLMGDTMAAVDALWTIASALGSQGNLVASTREYRRALELLGDKQVYRRFAWLGELAGFQVKAGRVDTAFILIHQAEALASGQWPATELQGLRLTTARAHVLRRECVAAVDILRVLLDSASENTEQPTALVSEIESTMAEALLCGGKVREALHHARTGLRLAVQYDLIMARLNAHRVLAAVYKALCDAPQALEALERFHSLKDSLSSTDATAAAGNAVLYAQFQRQQIGDSVRVAETRVRDAALAEARVQRERTRRNIFLFAGLGLLVFGAVVLRQRGRIQKALQRSDELLLNILPEEVAAELKTTGSAEAVHIDQVTVLFTDFKGFTAMSEVVTPQQLVRDLNECFSAFDHITAKYGIEKIKTIGDAYMAAGGLPTPNTTHATDVIKAALEMRDFIAEGKARKIAAGLPYFEIRIGVHTGPVVAGIVGVKKFQYDIWGDTVNTASRMESSGEVGQVNISEATYALVREVKEVREEKELAKGPNPQPVTRQPATRQPVTRQPATEHVFTFTPRGKVQAKGKGEMEMYFVSLSAERVTNNVQ